MFTTHEEFGMTDGVTAFTGDMDTDAPRVFRATAGAAATRTDDERWVLCVGDSLTRGFQGTYALPARPYAAALAELLGPRFALDERGVDGDMSAGIAARGTAALRAMEQRGRRYAACIVEGGANDCFADALRLGSREPPVHDTPAARLRPLLDACLAHVPADGASRLVILTAHVLEARGTDVDAHRCRLNAALRAYAAEPAHAGRVVLVDTECAYPQCDTAEGRASGLWTSDCVHLTTRGYDELAAAVHRAVKSFAPWSSGDKS